MKSLELIGAIRVDGTPLVFPKIEYSAVFPQIFLVVAALVLVLLSSLSREKAGSKIYAIYTSIAGLVATASTYWLWDRLNTPDDEGPRSAFAGAIVYDKFALFFVITIGCALILASLASESWLSKRNINGPEYYVLIMMSAAGGMLMAAANDLIVVFLGLEILSIALYVLAGFNRSSENSREASLKYFILGSFASALFLYGIALTYGAIGTTNLSGIATFLSNNTLLDDGLLLAGMAFLGVGFAFKVAAVPFHQWTPDVYEGSPTPVVGFMAAVAKAAAFAALLRFFVSTLFVMKEDWQPIILVLAVLTLFAGSVVACVQRNVKRMLAYSSINHAGFILLGLQAANSDGVGGALFYLLAYTFMTIGAFAIVTVIGGDNDSDHDLETYRGLAKTNPGLALPFAIFLLAQAGVPLTAGFLAKFYVLTALVQNESYIAAVFAMLTAVIAAFFYLRLVVIMYSEPKEQLVVEKSEDDDIEETETSGRFFLPPLSAFVVGITLAVTIAMGVVPGVVDLARAAALDIF